jgi:hypothetical protein
MKKSNFEELEAEMEAKFANSADKIKANVNGQRSFWAIGGELVELYLTKIIGALIGSDGTSTNTNIKNDDEVL